MNITIMSYLDFLCYKNYIFYLIQHCIKSNHHLYLHNMMKKAYYSTQDVWNTFNISFL